MKHIAPDDSYIIVYRLRVHFILNFRRHAPIKQEAYFDNFHSIQILHLQGIYNLLCCCTGHYVGLSKFRHPDPTNSANTLSYTKICRIFLMQILYLKVSTSGENLKMF